MKEKWLYRLEAISPNKGLWYNSSGKFHWGISIIPGLTKYLAMDYDVRYKKDGRDWYSSCSNIKDLSHWYSLEDALILIKNGFVFTKYLATEYVEYEHETTFIKETVLDRKEIDIKEIWNE